MELQNNKNLNFFLETICSIQTVTMEAKKIISAEDFYNQEMSRWSNTCVSDELKMMKKCSWNKKVKTRLMQCHFEGNVYCERLRSVNRRLRSKLQEKNKLDETQEKSKV